jgi:tetratricopeptide (TPR) repeat protein
LSAQPENAIISSHFCAVNTPFIASQRNPFKLVDEMTFRHGNPVFMFDQARSVRALIALLAASWAGAGGCQLFRQHEPISKPVAQSRQLSDRGLNAMEHGDLASAQTLLSQAVKACPTDIEAHRQYAEALWNGGQRELAMQQMQKALKLAPNDPQLALRWGEMNFALGNIDDARRMADQALDLTPNDPRAWALRGRLAGSTGQYDQALADFDRSLEFCHDDRQLLLETAELYRRLNRPQRALSTLTSLCETYGPNEEPQDVLYLKGLALEALNRYDDAADAFAVALDHGPPTSELYYRLGESQLAAGRQAEADRSLAQALSIDPNHAPSRNLRDQIEVASRPSNTLYP